MNDIRSLLRVTASVEDAKFLQRFFKTGPGQYAEGDQFLGVRVPATRDVLRQTDDLAMSDVLELLHSAYHEERLLALLILVKRVQRKGSPLREEVYNLYLKETRHINNWDLVDLSAPQIVGGWLLDHPRGILYDLVASESLWERRIAVLATFAFIRNGEFEDSVRLCERLLGDTHDLMHKACGWMLREVGKRDLAALRQFLKFHSRRMPRTMLRYSIEKMSAQERKDWMAKE